MIEVSGPVTPQDPTSANSGLPTMVAGDAPASSNKPFALSEKLRGLVPNYLNTCTTQIAKLRTLVAGGDFDAIRLVRHNLKGSAHRSGFHALPKSGEAGGRGRCLERGDEFPELIEQLVEAVAEGEQMVRSW
ncbi:MAG TPA: Hpt domain-containing protein [Bryobacteraceae bacterium]|jgi:HPt (histidine-containing phosphotransfer) domain-containing protein